VASSDDTASTPKSPGQSRVVLNTLMMPEHANHFGNVHGGIIMKLADEAAAIAAMRHAQKRAVTVTMDSMTFRQPIQIGDLVTCTAYVTYVSRSSMEVSVVVHAENLLSGQVVHTNSAFLVFVALSDQGRPSAVPPLLLETDADRAEHAKGEARQKARLAQRHN